MKRFFRIFFRLPTKKKMVVLTAVAFIFLVFFGIIFGVKTAVNHFHSEDEIPPAETITEEKKELHVLYAVPLDEKDQTVVIDLCKEYRVDPSLVFAMMWQESDFDPLCEAAEERSYGIMQINICNFEEYGLNNENKYDLYANTKAGIEIISEHIERFSGDETKALMAYNKGLTGARRLIANGVTSTRYSRSVLDKQYQILEDGVVYYY